MPAESNQAASHIIRDTFNEQAVRSALESCRARLEANPDIAILFVSPDWQPHISELIELTRIYGHAPRVFGCSTIAVVGTGEETEQGSGCSMLLLRLPHSNLQLVEWPEDQPYDAHDRALTDTPDADGCLVLGNPESMAIEPWLDRWNTCHLKIPAVGGLASGGHTPGSTFLFTEEGIRDNSAMALLFKGGLRFNTLVGQGCRPIGQAYTITGATQNVLTSVGSRRPYDVLEEAFHSLSVKDRMSAKGNILAGLAVSEYLEEHQTGDFLVRNIIGGDPEHGGIAIAAHPRVGQTLQFQLRDPRAANEEWHRILDNYRKNHHSSPFAGLLFPCLGRGQNFFNIPDHDASMLADFLGHFPLAGGFANGEFGPVNGRLHIHAFSATAALLHNPD